MGWDSARSFEMVATARSARNRKWPVGALESSKAFLIPRLIRNRTLFYANLPMLTSCPPTLERLRRLSVLFTYAIIAGCN